MSTLFVLLDGAEDHRIPEFGGRKPMEVADTPFMDSLVKDRGSTQGSTYTHLFINKLFTGHPPLTPRGAIEALGLRLRTSPSRVAYRLSPAYISNGNIEWAYHVDEDQEKEIIRGLEQRLPLLRDRDPDVLFFLKGRAVMTMESDDVLEMPCPPMPAPLVRRPEFMWPIIAEIADELKGLTVMPWGGGRVTEEAAPHPALGPLTTVSNSPTALGISHAIGQEAVRVDRLADRFPLARRLLDKGNVFLHADEIDEVSHQRDPALKVRTIEEVDTLLEEHVSDFPRIVLLVDHGTSSLTGEHIQMEVPVMSSYRCSLQGRCRPLDGLMPLLLSGSE